MYEHTRATYHNSPVSISIDSLIAAITYTRTEGNVRCVACRGTMMPAENLSSDRGYWLCAHCADDRERCKRGPRSGNVRKDQPPLPHWGCAAFDTSERCPCGMWMIKGQEDRHRAHPVHQYLLPIAHMVNGRTLLTGDVAYTLRFALSGADGKIGGTIHPALARWLPFPTAIHDHATYRCSGMLAVSDSVFDVIKNTIETLHMPYEGFASTWASAFAVAYDVQSRYSKAPLAMWQLLMPAPHDNHIENSIRKVQSDLTTRLGFTIMERAREVTWVNQIAAASKEA